MARLGATGREPRGPLLPGHVLLRRRQHRRRDPRARAQGDGRTRLAAAWEQRATDLPFATPYEALILASIVEKETGKAVDRPLIASVFVNRLRKGMRLQSDPTVIYGMGAKFDGDLRKRDLETDTPYNTYTREGLPPTPIALPSQASLDAVLNPPADRVPVLRRARRRHVEVLVEPRGAQSRRVAATRRADDDGAGARPLHHARRHRRRGQEHARAVARGGDRGPGPPRDGDARARRHAARRDVAQPAAAACR